MTEQTTQTIETIRIQAYSLAEALQQAQEGVQQGYTIDLESNLGYPQQFGSMITFTLLKAATGGVTDVAEVVSGVESVEAADESVLPRVQTKVPAKGKQK